MWNGPFFVNNTVTVIMNYSLHKFNFYPISSVQITQMLPFHVMNLSLTI